MMYLKYRASCKYLISEGPNYSDIFVVKRNGYSAEYEIKTNKQDFDRELAYIHSEEPRFGWHRADNKIQKHHYYKQGVFRYKDTRDSFGSLLNYTYTVPNKYYFAVPWTLQSYVKEKIQSLPYGLITFEPEEDNSWWRASVEKEATFLHKEKADPQLLEEMLNRAVNEMMELRDQHYRRQVNPNNIS